jgi:hypothetical protein
MSFKGTGENPHFFRHEKKDDHLLSVQATYKIFSSSLRDANIKGITAVYEMFPEEYSDTRLVEASLSQGCRLFATRSMAEKTLWKQFGSVLEIGVASGDHAVSLITATNARSYCGIDIDYGQLCESSKKKLSSLSTNCEIRLIQSNSLVVLDSLVKQSCTFDSIYIDANHWHFFVSQELDFCSKLLALNGRIVLNDYLDWFVGSMEPCGVKRAVNEFLSANPDWCIDYFAINDCDISLTRA